MGETIENMINVLESEIDFLKDKVKYNNLDLQGDLEQFKDMKDKDEYKRVLHILKALKINSEYYINKIK